MRRDGPGGNLRGEPTLETFERRMCACRDAACARQVVNEMAAWSRKLRATRDDPAETAQVMKRYNTCMAEAAAKR